MSLKCLVVCVALATPYALYAEELVAASGLTSIDAGYTITKVRSVQRDGEPYIVVSSYDGSVYCLDHNGKLLWKFHPDNAPMNAVCIIHKGGKPYVVCGGFDLNI